MHVIVRDGCKELQEWWNGRHEGLKILWPLPAVWVRVPLPVRWRLTIFMLSVFFYDVKDMDRKNFYGNKFLGTRCMIKMYCINTETT